MAGIGRDVKFGLRMLAKSPTFAVVSVLTLGLGIGATTAIFSVVDAVVVRPLPYPEPDRLVRLYTQFPQQKFDKFWLSAPEYFDVVHDATAFVAVASFVRAGAAISTRERPLRAAATYSTASLAATLGVQPALGRYFSAKEDLPNQSGVAVIGDRLWRTAFGGDRDIIGRHVTIDAMPALIIGVMPPGFGFPDTDIDLYLPLGLDPASSRGSHGNSVVARLADGVTVEADNHFLGPPNHLLVLWPLKDEVVGSVKTTLWILQIAVFLVLLIACANISNLLLARAEARSREIAIRNALGANRWRLVRQFLTESLVLGALGGVVGVLVAIWGVDATVALLPPSAPRASEIHVDLAVLAFAAVCALGASLLFGLAPVVHTRISSLSQALRDGTRGAGTPRQRLRRALVVTEVALAVVLLIGSGLMTRSFIKLSRVDVGFDPQNLLTGQVEIPEKTYPGPADARGYWVGLQERLRAIPGVEAASVMTGLPPARRVNANDMELDGQTRTPDQPIWNVDFWQTVGDDYDRAMRLHMVTGRWFADGDTALAPPVVVINEAFARKFFPGVDPLGKKLRLQSNRKDVPAQTIIGIVHDVKQQGVDAPVGTEVYLSLRQAESITARTPSFMNIAVRGALDAKALSASVRAAVAAQDATIPLDKLRTMDEVLWEAVARPRFIAFLLAVFAGLALVLAAVGIYGVMAYTVAQRTHELGIRMALGAQTRGLRRLVLRDGLVLAGAGVAVGLLVAVAVNVALASRLASVLYDVAVVDGATFAGVSVGVFLVSAVACLVPAIRATRVDPLVALRAE